MSFYLGKTLTDAARVEYPPKHLTTHGLVFGMTGSGKTGLALGLLEEAQRAGIPIIAIDPKGDLGNLALAWPELSAGQFAAWLDPGKLGAGASALDLGLDAADKWRAGLAADGLGPDDIAAMRKKAALSIYTPGSTAGIPVSLVSELAPPSNWSALPDEDRSELVEGLVAALLSLVGVSADPLQSKEAILATTLILDAWGRGETLDLAALVKRLDDPTPWVQTVGAYPVDEFLPPKKRKELAMQLNALVAAPSFQAWRQGEPLDVDALLARDPRGSRTSIFSIAHLDDAARMSFVTLLLDRVIGWMRAQPGTGDLRALLYMDEVFGYLPPHPANPSSKRPLLTLMKQARAFGLGVVLATQNPIDIDYKALTNAGTWLVGKLQTDNDKDRVLDGLMAASTAAGPKVSRADMSAAISALEPRQFVLQDANASGPVTFRSRFAMSYLRGPMTRQEIGKLADADFYNAPEVAALGARRPVPPARPAPPRPAPELRPRPPEPPSTVVVEPGPTWTAEVVGPGRSSGQVVEITSTSGWPVDDGAPPRVGGLAARYVPSTALLRADVRALFGLGALPAQGPVSYRPALLAEAHAAYRAPDEGGQPLDGGVVRRVLFPLPAAPGSATWSAAEAALDGVVLASEPAADALFLPPPAWVQSPADRERAKDVFVRDLVRTARVRVPACPPLGVWGQPGESLEAFKTRLAPKLGAATERAVQKVSGPRDHLEASFDKKVEAMKEQLAADKREIEFLMQKGDAEALKRARLNARVRLDRYKELLATREKFVDLGAREVADVEFAALDKLEACVYQDLVLEPRGVRLVDFGLLWIPNR